MPPKPLMTQKSSTFFESDETDLAPCIISLSLFLCGEPSDSGDWLFLVLFKGQIVFEGKWINETIFEIEALPMNLRDKYSQDSLADNPLIFIIRLAGGKGSKDLDPLLNVDNRLGGTLDLLPLLLGEENIFITVPLTFISTGGSSECKVEVRIVAKGTCEITKVPLIITMISAHCLPYAREGTVYLSAIGLDGVFEPMSVNFGMSLSSIDAKKIMWASASNLGQAANTAFNVPNQDVYIPYDLVPKFNETCRSIYWNAMKRFLIDPQILKQRLSSPFLLEIAGVPKAGKIDVRGRYMGFIDASALLESDQYGVSICTRLLFYNETELPEGNGPLLDLPPSSAKPSARESNLLMDEHGHTAFVIVRLDIAEPLVSKVKMATLFDTIGFSPPDGPTAPVHELEIEPAPENTLVDVRRISRESGALAVHKELSNLACRGQVPMNQGIKHTAANRLLMRVRTMLKQFPPGNCSLIDWQDIVTAQHGASRRAVTSSFAPQPPPLRQPSRVAAARCRIAGDTRIAEQHIQNNLNVAKNHPRTLLSKALRCLEERNDTDARNYLLEALSVQVRNKYLLWTYGGQEFHKGYEGADTAAAAFRIAVKGDYSDGTANAIGWAALHTFYHYIGNPYAAYVAAMKMRKANELPREWKKFCQRWTDISGEEERVWIPYAITSNNPLLITAAFFLCLRCYKFSEKVLYCYEHECATRGSRSNLKTKLSHDLYYLQATSLLLRRQYDKALEVTVKGIKSFGPSPIMSQMRTSCLMCIRGWDGECANALKESEGFGSEECPAVLLCAAINEFKTKPTISLQRAARAHKIAPCAHSALTIGRIYKKLGEDSLAERWAATAVKLEPSFADGWAFLSLLAMYGRNLDRAITMLRTAKQAGPISQDIEEEVKKVSAIVQLEKLPDLLVKNLCMSAVVLFATSGFLLYRLFLYRHFIGINVEYPAILLLMMAIITCSIAWIGWRTAMSMHQIHVIITGLLIVLVVVIEFSCFVWAMVVWDSVEIEVKTAMTKYFEMSHSTEANSVDMIRWDKLHVQFECCGVIGPSDYASTGHVPFSCCGQGPLDAAYKPYASECSALYQRGCGKQLHEYTKHQLLLVSMTALCASILQSTGIFCTFFLAHAISQRRRASIRNSTSIRESTFAAPDTSLLSSPTAPAPTLPKY